MNYDIIPIDADTDQKLVNELSRLTFKEDSLMRSTLLDIVYEEYLMWPWAPDYGEALRLFDDNGKFVAWALVFRHDRKMHFYCWVKTRERRKGYGKELIRIAKEIWNEPLEVKAHDKRSSDFFRKYN